jgi:hypothetical protein
MTFMYEPTGVSLLHSTDEPSADARFREEYAHENHRGPSAIRQYSAPKPDEHILERMWMRIGSFRTFA